MNPHLKVIQDLLQQNKQLTPPESEALLKAIADADKQWNITDFKLDRTEKVKRTTAILLEETIAELEQKRKAVEAQKHELEIEAALEKVRSRSLAMHESDELREVVTVVFQKLQELDFGMNEGAAIIIIFPSDNQYQIQWITDPTQSYATSFKVPYSEHSISTDLLNAKKSKIDFFSKIYPFEEKNSHFNFLFEFSDYKLLPAEIKKMILESRDYGVSVALAENSAILIPSTAGRLLSKNEEEILQRFIRVFEQSYTRFLDLQKAESQAREAKIEAALERVRVKAMAMHKTEDLNPAVAVVFEELEKLDLGVLRCGISVLDKEKRTGDVWVTSTTDKGSAVQVSGDESFDIHPLLQGAFDAWLKQEDFYYLLEGEELTQYYKAVRDAHFQLPESQMISADSGIKRQYCFAAALNAGVLFAFREQDFSEEARRVMKRFANVFDLTYKRFLDLQKAEKQAREAQIEAALERVRSRSMAMHKSVELLEVINVVSEQLQQLNIRFDFVSFGFITPDLGFDFWLASPGFGNPERMYVPYIDNPIQKTVIEAHRNGVNFFTNTFNNKDNNEWLKVVMDNNKSSQLFAQTKDYLLNSPGFARSAVLLKNMSIFIGNYVPKSYSEEENEILKRFANVFEQSYTRFLDLQKAEAQALQAEQDLVEIKAARKKAEEALAELQITQKQLIQSEKMASLGELTAGIAHEIQNPLNFVNNFSDVSNELIDEMMHEVAKGNFEEAKIIAEDVRKNLEKISHHGKRADGIVKGMLQHSRMSSGQKELTDLNALADEYLRLAYHGLRAKDKSFNAKFETDFDNSIGKINIAPQEIGRVLLNLVNNAFYAVTEKKNQQPESYEPIVTVHSEKKNGKIEISVKDNGNGIPKAIIEKIFQPFFTTKPTGQGTGLGLSLAYDIVTKGHGGELKVETSEGEGSEFIIQLPLI